MASIKRNLKMGMVGGGPGAFIGEVHRKAARIDGGIDIVAGAFDIDPSKSKEIGERLCIDPERAYGTYPEMIEKELARPVGERIDFVSLAVPNNWHFPIARDFLKAGFHVICEKPMTTSVADARRLHALVKKSGLVFALTHNYTGYPMVKLARDLVRSGELGAIRKIVVQYVQGWLSTAVELINERAGWRTDPKQAGPSCCMGDIGTHAENLAEYVSGLRITDVCADLTTFIPGRKLDDDGSCLLRFDNGARGVLMASQVSVGQENNLAIWVYGEKKGIEWHQEHPNALIVRKNGAPAEIWRRGNDYVAARSAAAARATRLPAGHPEAFLEAFGNIYKNATATIRARLEKRKPTALELDFPTVDDGLRGMLFLETVLKSSRSTRKWTKMPALGGE